MVELKFKDPLPNVRVEFNEKQHSYWVAKQFKDGTWSESAPKHGVTTPLSKTVDKPFIAPWVAKLSVHEVLRFAHDNPNIVDQVPQMFSDLDLLDNEMVDESGRKVMSYYKFVHKYPWLGKLKSTYKDASTEGKDLGSWIHTAIENFYNAEALPVITAGTKGMWESFQMFNNLYKPSVDQVEFVVYSPSYDYSGKGDFRGSMNGKTCIGDWKSTNRSKSNEDGVSFDNFFQLGGLAQAEFERTGEWVQDVFIANFDKKGEEPIVIWASDFGMATEDCAKAYIAHLMAYKTQTFWEYKFKGK